MRVCACDDYRVLGSDLEWERLAKRFEGRRLELEMTLTDVARRTGLHRNTINKAISRRAADPVTLRKIDRALGWRTGSAQAILHGDEPAPLGMDEPSEPRAPRSGDTPATSHEVTSPGDFLKRLRDLRRYAEDMNWLAAARSLQIIEELVLEQARTDRAAGGEDLGEPPEIDHRSA